MVHVFTEMYATDEEEKVILKSPNERAIHKMKRMFDLSQLDHPDQQMEEDEDTELENEDELDDANPSQDAFDTFMDGADAGFHATESQFTEQANEEDMSTKPKRIRRPAVRLIFPLFMFLTIF